MAEPIAPSAPGGIEVVCDANWREFCAAPVAVLMLAERGCPACRAWTEELRGHLEHGPGWPRVRFGKIELDGPEAEGESGALVEGGAADGEADDLYDQAVEIVIKTRRPSISLVQRHLRIGYNRAARLIEQMERSGLVSAMQSNGNREVLAPAPAGDAA